MLLRFIFTVHVLYLKVLLKGKNNTTHYGLAGFCLKGYHGNVYRLSAKEKSARLVGLKVMVRSLNTLFRVKANQVRQTGGTMALLDETLSSASALRIQFIEKVSGEKIGLYLCKEELLAYPLPFPGKLLMTMVIGVNTLWIAPLCFFSSRRIYHAMYLYFITESILSLYHVKKAGLKKACFSAIFSHDSNINYLLFQQNSIHVIKNPSEDPLAFDNTIVMTDGLLLCNPYQQEELRYLEHADVKYLIGAIPEQSLLYAGKYTEQHFSTPKGVIGFYSSGSWLRQQFNMNYHHMGIDCAQQEEDLLLQLKKYIANHPECKLKIFLHPLEKKSQNALDLSFTYHRSLMGNIPFSYSDINTHTCLDFEACDTALSLFSGSTLYRLMFGFKGLYYVPGNSFPRFPYSGTSIAGINAGQHDFDTLLTDVMQRDSADFFRHYNLEQFLYKNMNTRLGETISI